MIIRTFSRKQVYNKQDVALSNIAVSRFYEPWEPIIMSCSVINTTVTWALHSSRTHTYIYIHVHTYIHVYTTIQTTTLKFFGYTKLTLGRRCILHCGEAVWALNKQTNIQTNHVFKFGRNQACSSHLSSCQHVPVQSYIYWLKKLACIVWASFHSELSSNSDRQTWSKTKGWKTQTSTASLYVSQSMPLKAERINNL